MRTGSIRVGGTSLPRMGSITAKSHGRGSGEPISEMRVSSPPVAKAEAILCPYCGSRQKVSLACESCGGRFDVASLQATQNDMGSWFVRDSRRPHFVGYSHHAIVAAIRSGEIGRDHIVRGPSTRQLWTVARRAAGIAHLFGRCYACQGPVTSEDGDCTACGTRPTGVTDRNFFGLPQVEALPQHPIPDEVEEVLGLAFVVDSGNYIVRAAPVNPPSMTEVRVAAPDVLQRPALPAARLSPVVAPVVAAATAPIAALAGQPHVPAPARSAAIDESLAHRLRSLKRMNLLLLVATASAVLASLVIAVAYVSLRDSRDSELANARNEAIESVKAEFERRAPVKQAPPIELPSLPDAPPANR